jgi:hypothetical protein
MLSLLEKTTPVSVGVVYPYCNFNDKILLSLRSGRIFIISRTYGRMVLNFSWDLNFLMEFPVICPNRARLEDIYQTGRRVLNVKRPSPSPLTIGNTFQSSNP